jgi:hypothetical protein
LFSISLVVTALDIHTVCARHMGVGVRCLVAVAIAFTSTHAARKPKATNTFTQLQAMPTLALLLVLSLVWVEVLLMGTDSEHHTLEDTRRSLTSCKLVLDEHVHSTHQKFLE